MSQNSNPSVMAPLRSCAGSLIPEFHVRPLDLPGRVCELRVTCIISLQEFAIMAHFALFLVESQGNGQSLDVPGV